MESDRRTDNYRKNDGFRYIGFPKLTQDPQDADKLGRIYHITIPEMEEYIPNIVYKGKQFLGATVTIPPQPATIFVPETEAYGPIDFETPEHVVVLNRYSNGAPAPLLNVHVGCKRYRLYPPKREGQKVPLKYKRQAYTKPKHVQRHLKLKGEGINSPPAFALQPTRPAPSPPQVETEKEEPIYEEIK